MAEEKKEVALTFSEQMIVKLDSVNDALPKDFNKMRFTQNLISVINDNQALQKVDKAKLFAGALKGAYLGLDFFNKEAHLIPFGNSVQFIPDFRGSRKLVKKYSIKPVDEVNAYIVRDGDEFELNNNNGVVTFNFTPKPFNNNQIVGAFAYVLYTDGQTKIEMMNIDELEKARQQSKASNSPAWKNFLGEMYRKTVLHRLCKNVDLEFENNQQKDLFMAGNEIDTEKKDTPVDNPFADEIEDVAADIVVDENGNIESEEE